MALCPATKVLDAASVTLPAFSCNESLTVDDAPVMERRNVRHTVAGEAVRVDYAVRHHL